MVTPASTCTEPVAGSTCSTRFSRPSHSIVSSVMAQSLGECPLPITRTVRPSADAARTSAATSATDDGSWYRAGCASYVAAQLDTRRAMAGVGAGWLAWLPVRQRGDSTTSGVTRPATAMGWGRGAHDSGARCAA